MIDALHRLRLLCLGAMADVVLPGTATEALRVAPRHRWLLERWLEVLADAGVSTPNGKPDLAELPGLYASLGFPPEMAPLHRSALERLPELLRDEVRIQDVLFSGTDVLTALAAYQTNVITDRLNATVADLVRAAAPARVVEIGGGTGRLTAAVLPELAGADYCFTDVSRLFTRAAERFGVRTGLLDLNRPFPEQGFPPGSADVVLAGHALHNAVHIGQSLGRIRDLLAPGGELVFTESVAEDPAVLTGMQFLLSPEPGKPVPREGRFFLDETAWRTELSAAGFIVEPGDAIGGQQVFRAKLRDAIGTTAVFVADPDGETMARAARERGQIVVRGNPDAHPAKVLAQLEKEAVTTAVLSPSLARTIPFTPAAALTDLSALTKVVCQGPLTETERAAWRDLGQEPVVLEQDRDLVADATRAAETEIAALDAELAATVAVGRVALLSMLNAFHRVGCFAKPGDRHPFAEIVAATQPLARYRPLLDRWLVTLCREGLLHEDAGALRVTVAPEEYRALEARWDEVRRAWSKAFGTTGTVDYAQSCATRLPELLRGTCDPVSLLFPQGRPDAARAVYREGLTARYQHRAVAAMIAGLADAPLRVLEAGAGTGATTEAVLAALAGRPVTYVFTDVSRYFLDQARAEFGTRLEYGLLDFDAEPEGQGYRPGSFDVVVAGGALNAATDTAASVARLVRLLAPGGWLLLTEPTAEEHWVLISQAFLLTGPHDARAEAGATFLTLPQWNAVLDGAGVVRRLELPPPGHPLETLGHRVFGAQLP
ncbi:class I SAM-dependent methyltransferase [Amycolatopsis jejuensis]|uniref:class I SAM-dependent methyltransferase n=1 Tax=Amycolatopsis jejuensis TaxID=330084 RepID=UPI00068B1A52|nr:class I SAM-dependent methyltransferase [Amycolatopsis jejuensis]